MYIFILAGGFGTRLKSVLKDVPKPIAPITSNKVFLDLQIDLIRSHFPDSNIHLLTHYLSDAIKEYYKNDAKVTIIKEQVPLGTGGSIINAIKHLSLPMDAKILVFNGDTYITPNLKELVDNTNCDVSIVASFQEECSRFGSISIKDSKIIEFKEKDVNCRNSYINAGCYFFNNLNILKDNLGNNDIVNFAIETLIQNSLRDCNIMAYLYHDVFIDIGIPEDYNKIKKYIGE